MELIFGIFILFNLIFVMIYAISFLYLYLQMNAQNNWSVKVDANTYHEYNIEVLLILISIITSSISIILLVKELIK